MKELQSKSWSPRERLKTSWSRRAHKGLEKLWGPGGLEPHFAFLCSRQWLMFPFSWPLPFNVLRLILCPSAKIFLGCFRSQGLLALGPFQDVLSLEAYYAKIV